jgi:hypothetical protein
MEYLHEILLRGMYEVCTGDQIRQEYIFLRNGE